MIDLIHSPSITSKSTGLMEKRKYTFLVDLRLTKPRIKALIEEFYDVDVISVNTFISAQKRKNSFKRNNATRPRYKKAIITIQEKQTIPILV